VIEFDDDTRRLAERRAGHRCEVGLFGCGHNVGQYHHRRMKSQGGTGTLANCVACCLRCHAAIHANPDWAYRHGLLVRSWADPADVPVTAGCGLACQQDHASQ
jgi:hypothetical protein